jgi:hypothetical protein
MPRTADNIGQRISHYITRQLNELDAALMAENAAMNSLRYLIRLRRLTLALEHYYPALVSEADLVEVLPDWRCHERYEIRVLPPKRQPKTTERVIREHVRDLRVIWKLPIVSFTHKKGEANDPEAAEGARLYGYRWASRRSDLQAYKRRIRPEIKEHMLAQMERYEAMDHIEGVLWQERDNFFRDINTAVEALDTRDVQRENVQPA